MTRFIENSTNIYDTKYVYYKNIFDEELKQLFNITNIVIFHLGLLKVKMVSLSTMIGLCFLGYRRLYHLDVH
jgi:hypothetical protein